MALVAAISTAAAYIFRIWVKWPDVDESAMAKKSFPHGLLDPSTAFKTCPLAAGPVAKLHRSESHVLVAGVSVSSYVICHHIMSHMSS